MRLCSSSLYNENNENVRIFEISADQSTASQYFIAIKALPVARGN